METALRIFFFRILRNSFVFRYWYRRHLNQLLFDLELMDIDGPRIIEKYKLKLAEDKKHDR